MDGWIEGWIEGWTDGWIYRCMNGCMGMDMDGWIESRKIVVSVWLRYLEEEGRREKYVLSNGIETREHTGKQS